MFVLISRRDFLPDVVPHGQEATMENGEFVCKTKGIYFFSYHVSAKSKVSLKGLLLTKCLVSLYLIFGDL